MTIRNLPGVLLLVGLAACTPDSRSTSSTEMSVAQDIAANKVVAHMNFLAADELGGRETGTEGYLTAANYVAAQFKLLGLGPGGTDDSYFQAVKFRTAKKMPGSEHLVLRLPSGEMTLKNNEDFLVAANMNFTEAAVAGELVFAGNGVSAPDFGHDDYRDLDVAGKIVVVMSGRPTGLPESVAAHFGSTSAKLEAAARHGAIGMLSVSSPEDEARYSWERLVRWSSGPRMNWLASDGTVPHAHPEILVSARLHTDIANQLFALMDETVESLAGKLKESQHLSRPLPASITARVQTEHSEITSPNVIGVLPGSDPVLKDEYVVYTAHLDAVGTRDPSEDDEENADLIRNGAFDNAIGIGMMIEVARAFTQLPSAPRRSIMFIGLTGEEKGLLGSEYFVASPTVPAKNIVANINIDMPVMTFDISDVVIFGQDNSTLGTTAIEAFESIGFTVSPDPVPEERFFTRSDQYSFVKAGIPAVNVDPGRKPVDSSVDGNAVADEFLKTHYHKSSDDMNLPIGMKTVAPYTGGQFLLGYRVANSDDVPRWHAGDFFGKTFGPDRMNEE